MKEFFPNKKIRVIIWASIVLTVISVIALTFSIAKILTSDQAIITTQSDEQFYALTCKVVEIDKEHDTVTMEDSTGHRWEFYGTEDWEINDCVSAMMDDCGTDSIFDDKIVSARYSSWTIK